jgi:hypothetical protein
MMAPLVPSSLLGTDLANGMNQYCDHADRIVSRQYRIGSPRQTRLIRVESRCFEKICPVVLEVN